jgi:hypothetical protein
VDLLPLLYHAEGLLPVTDRNGAPISTIKRQDGVDRLFVTFVAPAGGMR